MNSFHHIPVLFDEVMEWMDPQPDGVYADGTLGGGGHSAAAGATVEADIPGTKRAILQAIRQVKG